MSAAAPLYTNASPARMPGSVVASIVLHAAILGGWLYSMQNAAKHADTVITGVDIITVQRAAPVQQKPPSEARKAATTFDFLKMALPTVPRVAAPQMAQIKLPTERKALQAQAPKLAERARLETAPKLDMDLDKGRTLDVAKIEARIPTRQLSAMANTPKLEDIGRRRVANLPAALALEERRREATALQSMDAIKSVSTRRAPNQAIIQDAAPMVERQSGKFASKIASLLPEQSLDQRQAVMPQPVFKGTVEPAVREVKRVAAMQHSAPQKGVEIEGPLADRKVVGYELPVFPQWAREQGVLEASVAIRFWVDKAGSVLPNMRVENTSGYGRLDRLAMDSLSKWKFAPLSSEEKQWGVITFRFLLE